MARPVVGTGAALTIIEMSMQQSSPLLIPTLSAANFAVGFAGFSPVGVVAPIAAAFAITAAEAGWVMTTYALAYAIGSPILVALTGGLARRLVLAAGLGLVALAGVLSAVADTPSLLFATRILAAFGAGVVTPVAAAVAAASAAPERRGKALAATFFGMTLAQVVGVPAGTWLGYAFGWPVAFWAASALALLTAVAVYWLTPRDAPFQPATLCALASALFDWRGLSAIFFTATFLGSIYVVYTYMGPLLEARMSYDGDGISLTFLVFGLGAVVGNLLGGAMTDRLGANRWLMIVALTHIGFLPVYSLLPLGGAVFFVFVFVSSTLGWSFMAAQQTRLVTMAPARQGVTLALNASSIYIGAAMGAAAGGATIAVWGLGALGWAAGVGALIAVANLFVSYRLIGERS